jgi:hypothetical protein
VIARFEMSAINDRGERDDRHMGAAENSLRDDLPTVFPE